MRVDRGKSAPNVQMLYPTVIVTEAHVFLPINPFIHETIRNYV